MIMDLEDLARLSELKSELKYEQRKMNKTIETELFDLRDRVKRLEERAELSDLYRRVEKLEKSKLKMRPGRTIGCG